ncbi:MAG: hypothetical protein WKG07_15330 [Hymenobacter sp.]
MREQAWRAIQHRRLRDSQAASTTLFTELVGLRHQVALNAGFANFRDYMFAALGRFDYTAEDCFDFHSAIARHGGAAHRRLRPGAPPGPATSPPCAPGTSTWTPAASRRCARSSTGAELLEKTITVFQRLDPYLGDCLRTMRHMGHLDLESRKGKAPAATTTRWTKPACRSFS